MQEIAYNERREIIRLVIINSKTGNVAFEFGKAVTQPRKGTVQPAQNQARDLSGEPQKPATGAKAGATAITSRQKATEQQKEYIREHASDEDYMSIMQMYGAELEGLTANQAAEEIKKIDAANAGSATNKGDMIVTCERCGNAITGVVLPDGSMMTGAELVGKSKLNYGGVYCYSCMKALNETRKRNAG